MKFLRFCVLFLLMTLTAAASHSPQQAQAEPNPSASQPTATAPAGARTVYISDFDLDVAPRKSSRKPAPRTSLPSAAGTSSSSPSVDRKNTSSRSASATSQASASSDTSGEETPADRANKLINAVSENLVRALTQAGYDARRLPAGAPIPKLGLRIRGVFAEADERNRARRLLVGGESVGPNMLLFVGINNLTRPEQPLYGLANPPANDPRHGPVITVTSYAPAARFELSRDPSGDELEKIASKIAADLTMLVSANRLSLAQ
jgi:uncharacterized protein DUF4410